MQVKMVFPLSSMFLKPIRLLCTRLNPEKAFGPMIPKLQYPQVTGYAFLENLNKR